MKEKLTAVVQAMIDGGNLGILSSPVTLRYLSKDMRGIWMIQFLSDLGLTHEFSINDLLASPDAMKVFGEEIKCFNYRCSPFFDEAHDGNCVVKSDITDCSRAMCMPLWKHHAHKALDIIWEEGQEKAVEYLFNNLPKGD